MTGITWLHLSDWHQGIEQYRSDLINCDRTIVLNALIQDIQERTEISPNLAQIDFIVFSGDVAFSGQKQQYKDARSKFFDRVLAATGCRLNCLFIVPGNHDLDRDRLEKLPDDLKKELPGKKEEDIINWIKEWLENEPDRELLLNPFARYREFVTSYTGQKNSEYGSLQTLNINGIRVALLGLNSALMAGRHKNENDQNEYYDKGFLIAGESQIEEARNRIPNIQDCPLRIAVMHHPYDWLCEWDKDRVEKNLSKDFHFILQGHEHEDKILRVASPTSGCCIISGGSSFDRKNFPNGYNFVHLDFESQKVTIYPRKWIQGRGWISNHDITDKDKDHSVFDFPDNLKNNIDKLMSIDNPLKPPIVPIVVGQHCEELVNKLLAGEVIPFIGADINLCDRPVYKKRIQNPWKQWDSRGELPPTNLELAAYLDGEGKCNYIDQVGCLLCDIKPLPDECPIHDQNISRLALQHVSQYLWLTRQVYLQPLINFIYQHEYKPNRIHNFLAELPDLITSRYKCEGRNPPQPPLIIVTTCFDRTLERAFEQRRQSFDLVSYCSKDFTYKVDKYSAEDSAEDCSRPVIIRLYGSGKDDQFAITEDHFLDYLASNSHEKLPFYDEITNKKNFWFIGYSLSYWNLRGIIHRLRPASEANNKKWWVIQENPEIFDKELWEQYNKGLAPIAFFSKEDIYSLENYINILKNKITEKLESFKLPSP